MSGTYRSVFDIIGPVMVGPSSSHTAGAVAIGNAARLIFQKKPQKVVVHYYDSFAQTHRGHGTDFAIAAGIMGFKPDDKRVPTAPELAKDAGIKILFLEEEGASPINHPNTAIIDLYDEKRQKVTVGACSVGGGTIEIRLIKVHGITLHPQGPLPIILYLDSDKNHPLVNGLIDKLRANNSLQKLSEWLTKDGEFYEFDISKYLSPDLIKQLNDEFKGLIYIK